MEYGPLSTPCELAVKKYVPAIRATVALILVKYYGLSVYRVAKLLKVTPAAVSNYVLRKRGRSYVDLILEDKELYDRALRIAEGLIGEDSNDTGVSKAICELCRILRKKIEANATACLAA